MTDYYDDDESILYEKCKAVAPRLFKKFPYCGMSVGKGWHPLVLEISAAVESMITDDDDMPSIAQIKEKFAGLRFYVNNSTEEMNNLIHTLCLKADSICEFCGNPGEYRDDQYWVKTLCDKCNEERNNNK